MKYQTGQLKQQTFVSQSSGGRESKLKVSTHSVSGEGSLPGLQMAAFSLCPHMAHGGQRASSLVSLLIRMLSPSEGPTLMTRLTVMISQSPRLQMPLVWRLGCQHEHFGTTDFQSITSFWDLNHAMVFQLIRCFS